MVYKGNHYNSWKFSNLKLMMFNSSFQTARAVDSEIPSPRVGHTASIGNFQCFAHGKIFDKNNFLLTIIIYIISTGWTNFYIWWL
jgi:hypothetical protein